MKDPYVHCYVAGRCDYDEDDDVVEIEQLVEKVSSGSPMRDVTLAAAKAAVTKELDVAAKAQWLKDNAETIKAMGGNSEKAWQLYMSGRVDALASDLESWVLENLGEEEAEEDEDDDEDDADGGDEDGDDDSDDDDDDDEDEEP
jgi:hypothetical protein